MSESSSHGPPPSLPGSPPWLTSLPVSPAHLPSSLPGSPPSMASKNSSLLPALMALMTCRWERSPLKLSSCRVTEDWGGLGQGLPPLHHQQLHQPHHVQCRPAGGGARQSFIFDGTTHKQAGEYGSHCWAF